MFPLFERSFALAPNGAAAGTEMAIAGLFGALGAGVVVGTLVWLLIGNIGPVRLGFYVGLGVALLLFLAWLGHSCSPKQTPTVFLIHVLFDPVEVASIGALSIALLVGYLRTKPGAFGSVVITLCLAPVIIAEWFVIVHYVVPHYSDCGH